MRKSKTDWEHKSQQRHKPILDQKEGSQVEDHQEQFLLEMLENCFDLRRIHTLIQLFQSEVQGTAINVKDNKGAIKSIKRPQLYI